MSEPEIGRSFSKRRGAASRPIIRMRLSSASALRLSIVIAAMAGLAPTSFEVASIRPAVPDAFGSSGEDGRNGLLKVYNVSLRRCIRYAYGIPETQILGGPKWVDELRYDIMARADQALTEPELLRMLQPLLADRFKLALHRETRAIAGYELTVAKGGLRAPVSDPNRGSGGNGGRGRIDMVGTPVAALIIRLSDLLQRPVVDRTGDARRFDFHLRWTPDSASAGAEPAASEGPSMPTALEEQLGLKLIARRVPAEVLVIDHAELPTAN
jgi:uncharacterized protein (TIGR03435 family)